MLTLTLSSTGDVPTRMSTVLGTCANALIAEGFKVCYSEDQHSLLIRERETFFPPRVDLSIKLTVPAYNAIKALHDFEEDLKAQLKEDQGGNHG